MGDFLAPQHKPTQTEQPMINQLIRHTYSLLWRLITPLALLRLCWRASRQPAYLSRIKERFGFVTPAPKPGGILLHTVSVGEFLAAKPLLAELGKLYPDDVITVTTMTPTGSARVQAAAGPNIHHVYFPYDLPGAMSRFFNRIQPRVMIVMETELWLNAFTEAGKRNIPVYVVNARLSAKSAQGYRRFSKFTNMILDQVTHVAAQAISDANRFMELGLSPLKVSVCGSIKYDMARDSAIEARGHELRQQLGADRPVWIAASTREGEDKLVLQAFTELRKTHPSLCLLLVPRHPERFASAAQLASKAGFKVAKRSEQKNVAADANLSIDVYVGDTMGELPVLYAASDLAFVGGSLVPTGGHNVLEPLVYGKPTVVGPHVFNFATICAELLEAGGLTQVTDVNGLVTALQQLLDHEELRCQNIAGANKVLDASRGCLQRLIELMQFSRHCEER